MLVGREPDLDDYHKRKTAPDEYILKLNRNYFYKDGDIASLMISNPRFNILENSNCKELKKFVEEDPTLRTNDWLAKCIEQVSDRLNDNGASSQRIIEHVLEICHYFFQKHTLS